MFEVVENSDTSNEEVVTLCECLNNVEPVVELSTGIALVAGSMTPITSLLETKTDVSGVAFTQKILANVATGTRVMV